MPTFLKKSHFHILSLFALLALPVSLSAQEPTPAPVEAPVVQDLPSGTENTTDSGKTAPVDALDGITREIVEALQNYYNKAFSYSAQFKQVYETVDGIRTDSSGVVWFKKPGLMRWDYEKPEMRFLLSDGEFFWSWEPVYRQYCKQPLKSVQLPTALTFLAGQGRLEDDFNVKVQTVLGNRVTLELLPKVPTTAFAKIHFQVILPKAKVHQVKLFDAMGNENLITFEAPELNAPLDDKQFTFTPPPDATLICK